MRFLLRFGSLLARARRIQKRVVGSGVRKLVEHLAAALPRRDDLRHVPGLGALVPRRDVFRAVLVGFGAAPLRDLEQDVPERSGLAHPDRASLALDRPPLPRLVALEDPERQVLVTL